MMEKLPQHLAERTRHRNGIETPHKTGPVIVWLKSSFRLHENPAIEVGRHIAAQHGLPLLIYHGIDERYPHASLRHHTMLLDAAVDMDEGCRKAGLRYVLHVAREGHRPSVMKAFSQSASCIITDLFPLPPWTDWVETIAASAACPVLDVDCHCVIPMPLFGKSVDRPYKFRDATKRMRKQRLQASWPACEAMPEPYTGPLPFEPVNVIEDVKNLKNRFALLRMCSIDPTVLPVWHERGGERAALSKWQAFYDKGLNGYAKRRNNAADPSGVSRLSAAFHYGFLSPMRVAREAAAVGTKSAEKYLDELLIFREHPWHHIYSASDPYDSSNLPEWALQSWRETADDPRVVLLKDHEMEYAESPLELWNLCQRSLLRHGELHNNLRMTWGKAVPLWT
jgi:deoxyribodipyrimidine photolyase